MSAAALFPEPGEFTEVVAPTAIEASEVYLEENTTIPRMIFYVRSWLDEWTDRSNGGKCRLPPPSVDLGPWIGEMQLFSRIKGVEILFRRAEAKLSPYDGGTALGKFQRLMGEGSPRRGAVKVNWIIDASFKHGSGSVSAELDRSGAVVYEIRFYELWSLAHRGEDSLTSAAGRGNGSHAEVSSLRAALDFTERAIRNSIHAVKLAARELSRSAESKGLEMRWYVEVTSDDVSVQNWGCGGRVVRTCRVTVVLMPSDPGGSWFHRDGTVSRDFYCTWKFSFSLRSSARWVEEECKNVESPE